MKKVSLTPGAFKKLRETIRERQDRLREEAVERWRRCKDLEHDKGG